MIAIKFKTSTSIIEAVRLIKAESYRIKERVVGEFNNFILDSNKSEEDNIKDYKVQWNKSYIDGVDWEQRRYEIAKDVLVFALKSSYDPKKYDADKKLAASYAVDCADALIEKLKDKENKQ